MKKLITTLGVAAALSISVASSTAFSASHVQGWVDCNSEYSACLRDGTNLSIATDINEAVSQGSDNTSNWVQCNSSLASCYKSLN